MPNLPLQRGVYFDAWFPRQHCYHPSLPPRRLRMIDDLRDYRANVLVWAALGGGSLALPYLEQEAFGPIDPRFRFYGFLNDSEFVAEAQKHGIQVFGIVFEVQGWEFPAELNAAEDTVLALNETRGAGQAAWLGLREFSQNRYPKLWPAFEKYFPNGLVNSDGERVTDLIEACVSRDIHGTALHAQWVECPDRSHQCYLMDRNHPAWREYLKAVIRIQIDAGVAGVQLDEAELPITSFQYGGCFCAECMRAFRLHLQALPAEARPAELAGEDLGNFHYGQWLLARGYDFKSNRESTPLFWHYLRFQQGAITRYFGELADYARAYAASQGRSVLVSGNFFNLFDQYYPLEPKVDLIITEMRNTRFRQPTWYRYVAGFAGGKPVVVVENPYGGVVPELVDKLKLGRGYDQFRMSLYEAAALGANMSVPYGAWLGSVIQDSFHPPHDLCVEIQTFLADHEALFSPRTYNEVGVVYSVESNFQRASRRGLAEHADNRYNASSGEGLPFWEVSDRLVDVAQPYDVLFLPDGTLRPDSLTPETLRQYRSLILPECVFLTAHQARCLQDYLDGAGQLLVIGELGLNLDDGTRQALLGHAGTRRLETAAALDPAQWPDGPQAIVAGRDDLALHLQRLDNGAAAVHLIRYAYDEAHDRVPDLPVLDLALRLPETFSRVTVHAPGRELTAALSVVDATHHVHLEGVPLYCILHLEK